MCISLCEFQIQAFHQPEISPGIVIPLVGVTGDLDDFLTRDLCH
jgi:hypothetical protein